MPDATHRCPDCGEGFNSASALVDHSMATHIAPAAHMRVPRRPWVGKVVAALCVLVVALIAAGVGLAAFGVFDKAGAPETPNSIAHKMAVELKRAGAVDDYRAVEPADGWDTEYELDGDGLIRVKNERSETEELEYEAFSDDLRRDIERAAERRGFEFEE